MNLAELESILQESPVRLKQKKSGRIWHYDIVQNNDEWYELRMGKITASSADVVLASPLTTTGKEAAGSIGPLAKSAVTYCQKKLAERAMFKLDEGYKNRSMNWGNEMEAHALIEFQKRTNKAIETVGFVQLNDFVGCSPDAVIPRHAVVQIKCPEGPTHHKYLKNKAELVSDYFNQVQFEMFVCGLSTAYLVSFHPYFKKEKDRMVIVKIKVDKQIQSKIKSQISHMIKMIKNG